MSDSLCICQSCGFVDDEDEFDQIGLDKHCPKCSKTSVTERDIGFVCLREHYDEYEKELIDASSEHCTVKIDCDRCDAVHKINYTSHL